MIEIYSMPGHLIRRLHQISVSIFSDALKSAGIDLTPTQFAALSVLERNPGIDQATLAGMIALDRPTMGGVVERLAGKGLVERSTNQSDRRAKSLALTPDGLAMLHRMRPVVAATQTRLLEGLSHDEQATFTALAEKIADLHNNESRAPLVLPAATGSP